jgi:hypothetical protein
MVNAVILDIHGTHAEVLIDDETKLEVELSGSANIGDVIILTDFQVKAITGRRIAREDLIEMGIKPTFN